jgi:hypothetical protein
MFEYLQLSLSPVILISAINLLLLSYTNRYTNLTNRVRLIHNRTDQTILYTRIKIIKYSIIFLLICILLLSLLIIVLFITSYYNFNNYVEHIVFVLFGLTFGFLFLSVFLFMYDIYKSTKLIHQIINQNLIV